MSQTKKEMLVDPLVDNNPITLQVLGICSALAVTSSLQVSMVMALAVILRDLVSRPSSSHACATRSRARSGSSYRW